MTISLLELVEILTVALPLRVEEAEHHALGQIGELVATVAKAKLGTEQDGWAELAEYTLNEKARLGLPSPSPLLRTGEHIRDTIEVEVTGHTVEIGSNDQVAEWQEDGTSRMPPRPFLKTAAIESEAEIVRIVTENVFRALNSP